VTNNSEEMVTFNSEEMVTFNSEDYTFGYGKGRNHTKNRKLKDPPGVIFGIKRPDSLRAIFDALVFEFHTGSIEGIEDKS
jgi:hypothetical protein